MAAPIPDLFRPFHEEPEGDQLPPIGDTRPGRIAGAALILVSQVQGNPRMTKEDQIAALKVALAIVEA